MPFLFARMFVQVRGRFFFGGSHTSLLRSTYGFAASGNAAVKALSHENTAFPCPLVAFTPSNCDDSNPVSRSTCGEKERGGRHE